MAPVPPDELTSSEDDSIPPVGPLEESRIGSLVLDVGLLVVGALVVLDELVVCELVVGSVVVLLDDGDVVVESVVVGVPVMLPVAASEGDDVPLVQPSRPARTVAAVDAKNARRSSVLGLGFEELMIGGGEASRLPKRCCRQSHPDCKADFARLPCRVTIGRKNMRKIAIVGAGSAGLLTAAHLCTWLDKSWQVWAVHNPRKKILGIGESTNGAFINALERGTNFSVAQRDDMAALEATIKYGSKFVNWRSQSWVNPLLSGNIAIHFNNRRFKDFVFQRLSQLWHEQFQVLEADVQQIQDYPDHVSLVTDAGVHDFDYVVDCMGTPTTFENYTMSDCTLVDRCRIHTVEKYDYEPFTDHIATQHGWMFGVPLQGRKTYGYMYSHKLTSDEQVENDLKQTLGVSKLDAGEYDQQYAFRCYYANQLISGRVAKNGNKALFFEPLLANSMFLYVYAARIIYDHFVLAQDVGRCNGLFSRAVREMEDVISYYYKGGSVFDSEFWRAASTAAQARMAQRGEFRDYCAKLAGLKEKGVMYSGPPYAFSPHTWHIVDAQMGYRSFENA